MHPGNGEPVVNIFEISASRMGQFSASGLGIIPWLLMPDLSASIFRCSVPVLLSILDIFWFNISANVSEEHTANSVCVQLWVKSKAAMMKMMKMAVVLFS